MTNLGNSTSAIPLRGTDAADIATEAESAPLDPLVVMRLAYAISVHNKIGDLLDGALISGARGKLAGALIQLCLQHFGGVISLIEHGRSTPAFVLVRSQMDAAFRAIWILDSAKEKWIEKFNDRTIFPTTVNIIDQMKLEDNNSQAFKDFYNKNYHFYSDFTHGGYLSIAGQMNSLEISPSHPTERIIQLIEHSTIWALCAASSMPKAAKLPGIYQEITNTMNAFISAHSTRHGVHSA